MSNSSDLLLIPGDEVCGRLGIGKSTLHKLVRLGKFPIKPVRLGRAVRYSAEELAEWVRLGCPPGDRWRALQGLRN